MLMMKIHWAMDRNTDSVLGSKDVWGLLYFPTSPQAFSVYPKTLNCHTFAAVLLICHVGNVEVALFFEGLVGPIFTTPCMLPLRPLYIGTSVLNTLSYALLMSMIRLVHVLDNRLSGLTVTVFENNPSWWSSMRLLGCGDGGRTAVCGEGSWLSRVRFMTGCTCHTWACLGIITGSLVLLRRRIWFLTQATSCASGQQVGGPRIFKSKRGSSAKVASRGMSTGMQSSRYSPGRMTAGLFGLWIRKDWALRMLSWVVEMSSSYVTISDPFMTICFLVGLMAISLMHKKGIPARKSTSSSFTTRASSWKDNLPRLKKMWVSPSTDMGVLPSAWWAPWQAGLRGKPSLWAAVILIKLEVAPQSMVSLMALWS